MADPFALIRAIHQEQVIEKQAVEINEGEKVGGLSESVAVIVFPAIVEDWTIAQIVQRHSPLGWIPVFKHAWEELKEISQTLVRDEQVNGPFYPMKRDVFRVFELCPLTRVKVVIFGQDPYHSMGRANLPVAQGMSFSIRQTEAIPSSLQNIYKVLTKTVKGFVTPNHGDLTYWVLQGVFLLNTSLTVLPARPNSHKGYWMGLINKVIKAIVVANPNVIFLLWGREAQKMRKLIGERGYCLETSHPSGLGAHYGFNSSNHFNEVNTQLLKLGKEPIDWQIQ